jgi:hypothetical protein
MTALPLVSCSNKVLLAPVLQGYKEDIDLNQSQILKKLGYNSVSRFLVLNKDTILQNSIASAG